MVTADKEYVMDRNTEQRDSLIDLGAVSTETKGPAGEKDDHIGGLRQVAGLSDD